jgi:hypothetical protein
MTKGTRRDPLDILLEKQAAIEKRKADLAQKADPLQHAIAIARERREEEENLYLGAIARMLMNGDHALHRKMVDAAAKVIEAAKSKTKARSALLRVLGPLPVSLPATSEGGKPSKPLSAGS